MTKGVEHLAAPPGASLAREFSHENASQYVATYEFAEIALGQIKSLKQPAHPRNYEVWYHYATGYHPAVNQLVNQLLKTNGTLTQGDIDAIYDRFFSPVRQATEIDNATSRSSIRLMP